MTMENSGMKGLSAYKFQRRPFFLLTTSISKGIQTALLPHVALHDTYIEILLKLTNTLLNQKQRITGKTYMNMICIFREIDWQGFICQSNYGG